MNYLRYTFSFRTKAYVIFVLERHTTPVVCLVDHLRNSFRTRNILMEKGFVIHTIQGITKTQSAFSYFI